MGRRKDDLAKEHTDRITATLAKIYLNAFKHGYEHGYEDGYEDGAETEGEEKD